MTLLMVGVSEQQIDEVCSLDFDDFYEFVDGALHVDLDKLWAGFGWLVTRAGLDENQVLYGEPVEGALIGDWPPFLKTPDQVKHVCESLARVDVEVCAGLFDAAALNADGVYPSVWLEADGSEDEELRESLLCVAGQVRTFFIQCGERGLCTISLMC